MQTFTITLALDDDWTTADVVEDLNSAINGAGYLGGNFLVTRTAADTVEFDREWKARMTVPDTPEGV